MGNVRKRVLKQMVLANEGMRTEVRPGSETLSVSLWLQCLHAHAKQDLDVGQGNTDFQRFLSLVSPMIHFQGLPEFPVELKPKSRPEMAESNLWFPWYNREHTRICCSSNHGSITTTSLRPHWNHAFSRKPSRNGLNCPLRLVKSPD